MASYAKIISRCQDLELGFPGPEFDTYRKLSALQLDNLLRELDYLSRGEPDPRIRNRYHQATELTKREVGRRTVEVGEGALQERAREARRTGRETCQYGEHHTPGANYYVSAQDGARVALLSGPYSTHAESLAKVKKFETKAVREDSKAVFYSFGTVAMPATHTKKGQLD